MCVCVCVKKADSFDQIFGAEILFFGKFLLFLCSTRARVNPNLLLRNIVIGGSCVQGMHRCASPCSAERLRGQLSVPN